MQHEELDCGVFSAQARSIKDFQLDKPVEMKCAFCDYGMNHLM